ncbi:MAG: formate dehydrogenase accessory sulfurtransferase FdhD [Acetobacteraceae bacterium]
MSGVFDPALRLVQPAPTPPPDAQRPVRTIAWRDGVAVPRARPVAEETPVALTYQRATHAVMLASPDDLEDFAIGFSLSEGIITDPAQIVSLEVVALPDGIELRMDLASDRLHALTRRQRRIAGPSGCGLCGMDSLAEAIRPPPTVPSGPILTPDAIATALDTLWPAQRLNQATRAAHAAAFWTPVQGLVALREDIGRHNALDKLIGAMARQARGAADGVLLLSSRVSLEMAQKAAIMGVPVIVAVSAPTALAIDVAEAAGITLIGIARADGFEVFTHPQRIQTRSGPHVA